MRRTRIHAPARSGKDERIAQLEAELDEVRRDLVEMAPAEMWRALHGYTSCGSREEQFRWEQDVVAAAVALAAPDPVGSHWQPRAWCPLCRSGTHSSELGGFALPEGLSWHLLGRGRTHQCSVTKAAFRLARAHLQDCFRDEEKAARQLDEARRGTERLYLVAPWSRPRLLDEGPAGWGRVPRSPDGLQAAERWLADFGFRTEVDGQVVSYRLARDGLIVFADPRAKGRIDFVVCRDGARSWRVDHQEFYLLDDWKDLAAKFARRLAGAVDKLTAMTASS